MLTLPTFCYITIRQILNELLSNKNQYIHFEKIEKKSRGYGAQISEMGVNVNHAFNVFGEFSMCHTSPPIT